LNYCFLHIQSFKIHNFIHNLAFYWVDSAILILARNLSASTISILYYLTFLVVGIVHIFNSKETSSGLTEIFCCIAILDLYLIADLKQGLKYVPFNCRLVSPVEFEDLKN
jgi:hypothetical protein